MTSLERLVLAANDPALVVDQPGLLAPFNEAGVLAPLDVHAAATAARLYDEEDPSVVLAMALAVRGTRFGHVCIRLATQHDAVVVEGQEQEDIDALPWPEPSTWLAAVAASAMVGDGDGDAPLVVMDDRLYLERYFAYEGVVAALVAGRAGDPNVVSGEAEALLDDVLPRDPDGRTTRQRQAASVALGTRLAVIAGRPGTGKTYTVGAILSILARSRKDGEFPLVALVAPTGKAAARLGEAITAAALDLGEGVARDRLLSVEASTIHRLLGFHPARGRFAHHEGNLLPHDLVIVDEVSMLSLPLAAQLLAAIRTESTVVLVGDPSQLESIEAGTVLADIVRAGPMASSGSRAITSHVVTLERLHRFDEEGAIADFSDAVRTGDACLALEVLGEEHDSLRWIRDRSVAGFASLLERILQQRTNVVEIARQHGRGAEALAALTDLAVLAAHRKGPESVDQWRRDIEERLDERYPGLRFDDRWYPGRPVMITRNDYNLNLYNGDIGVTVESEDGRRVVFERSGLMSFPRSHIGEHETVHALTIHKSQGSQFKEVVVALPTQSSRLLTRELLYTAVTRATDRVWIIGDEAVVRDAVTRSVQRASGLGVRLWGA